MAKVKIHALGGWAYPASALHPLKEQLSDFAEVTNHAFNAPLDMLPREKKNWWLAGWSLGGMRALQAVADKKIHPAGLILISSTARFCRDGSYEPGVEKVALRVMLHGLMAKRERVLMNFFEQSGSPDENDVDSRIKDAGVFSTDGLIEGLKQLDELDLRENLHEIKIPVLIFHGAKDLIIPADAAKYMAKRIPKATVEIIDDAGHELAIHQADILAEHLIGALK